MKKIPNPKSQLRKQRCLDVNRNGSCIRVRRSEFVCAFLLASIFSLPNFAGAVTYCYVTIHNLGCRQANHTHTGFIYPHADWNEGDLVQVILAGPNRLIDIPNPDGSPGGDDQPAMNPGAQFGMNMDSFTHSPYTFYSPYAMLVQSDNVGPQPSVQPGTKFYVRAWNGPTPAQSTAYYNSQKLTLDYPIEREGCPIDSAVRTFPNEISIPTLLNYSVVMEEAGHPFSPANSVSVIAPNGGESVTVGQPLSIQWFASPTYTRVDILLKRGAGSWQSLFDSTANDGTESWIAQTPNNDSCWIRIQASIDTIVFDVSNNPFAIHPVPVIFLLEPDNDDSFTAGDTVQIQWNSVGSVGTLRILLARDAAPAETLFASLTDDGTEDWVVTGPAANNCVLRVESIPFPGAYDQATGLEILVPVAIDLLVPISGDSLTPGDTTEIQWSSLNHSGPVRLLLSRALAPIETLFTQTDDDGFELWAVTGPATDSATIRIESVTLPSVFDQVDQIIVVDTTYYGPPAAPEIVIFAESDSLRLTWPPAPYATSYRIEHSLDFVAWDSLTTVADTVHVMAIPELVPLFQAYRVTSIRD